MTDTYQIFTDSSCDLPGSLARELGLHVVPLSVQLRGREYENDSDGWNLDIKDFYNAIRSGELTSTSAVNPDKWAKAMEPVLAAGQDILVLAFSSGLSATYSSAALAAKELGARYPQRKLRVVDTLSASLGQGLLCYLTVQQQRAGKSLEEAADYAEQNRLHLCHWFTVDDLMFLKRGGRISAATALMGTMLKIKPVLHMDNAGHLVNVGKARGRRASIDALAAKLGQTALEPEKQTVFISHGDCQEDADYLAGVLRERYRIQDIRINYVGPVIGSHSGPGTLALFFLGSQR